MENTAKVGRPSTVTDNTVQQLQKAFELGANVSQACYYAGISRSTYYNFYANDEEFMDKIDSAKYYLVLQAKAIISEYLENKDLKTAMWFLEKYDTNKGIMTQEETDFVGYVSEKERNMSFEELMERTKEAAKAIEEAKKYNRQ